MRRLVVFCLACLVCSGLEAQEPYKLPPQVIVDILDAPQPVANPRVCR